MLPETLRLADYNLGHDDRAKTAQPVAAALGPRFYEWQLKPTPEKAWAETQRHAKTLRRIRSLGVDLGKPGVAAEHTSKSVSTMRAKQDCHFNDDGE
jgi:hypothetical protein